MLFLFTILTQQAHALDCYETPKVWPSFWTEQSNLPLNTVPMIHYSVYSLAEVPFIISHSGSDEILSAEITEIGDATYHFTPQSPLEANSDYYFQPEDTSLLSDSAPFSTGESIDDDAPLLPILQNYTRSTEQDEWGTWDYLIFSFEDQGDGAQYYRFEVANNPDFEDSHVVWETPSLDGSYSIGNDPACTNELTSEQISSWIHFSITAYDAAGHASEPLSLKNEHEPEHGDGPSSEKEDGGCTIVPTSALGIWWVLSLFGLRKRR